MRVATWNINSVRLRIGLITKFLQAYQPDILCLQETKCPPGQFPTSALAQAGYGHIAENGFTGHHGVAIVSRLPLQSTFVHEFCGRRDGRHIAVRPEGSKLTVHSLYVPAGGDDPDPDTNDKFAHKLQFLDEMRGWYTQLGGASDTHNVLTGDLNIAPLEHDVWSHKQLLRVVSHTPVETEKLIALADHCKLHDPVRNQFPEPEKLYTWWSYRARNWEQSNKGRRLDHILVPETIASHCRETQIIREARGWERPSDHVPVILDLDEPS